MTIPDSVLIVGASAAGLATAESLRRKGYQGTLTLLGAERHLPYDRPPLSKQVLAGAWEPDRTRLRPSSALAELGAEFILGDRAVGFDASTRAVETASGRTLRGEAVVIATGVRPRTIPGTEALNGVHVLRTLEDALELRDRLKPSTRLVVVGEGVLGSEIAATARELGAQVTMTGPMAAPMIGPLGPMVADLLGELHTGRRVRLCLGTAVAGLVGEHGGQVAGVRLDSGVVLPADLVVVAVGGIPNTDWLASSGLELGNGVICDSRCRAAEGVYAVGDVARWHDEDLGAHVRLENRTNATEQAAAVAANILGADAPYRPVPYFWSDQFNTKIQVYGRVLPGAEAEIVDGDPEADRFVARYRINGRAVGIVGWNMPKQARMRRQEIVDAMAEIPITTDHEEYPDMKITIDEEKCVAAGQCVAAAAAVFDQRDEDGIVVLLNANPPAELADAVREAAMACPAAAITITE